MVLKFDSAVPLVYGGYCGWYGVKSTQKCIVRRLKSKLAHGSYVGESVRPSKVPSPT